MSDSNPNEESETERDEQVRYNVQMPRKLREDAKRNCERGELAEAVRDVFRRKAYGCGSTAPSETERVTAELRDARRHLDELRHDRNMKDTKIQAQETRVARLEERKDAAEARQSDIEETIDRLQALLSDGERLWPTRIKNETGCSTGRATELHKALKDRNPDVPDTAFLEPGVSDPTDWRDTR